MNYILEKKIVEILNKKNTTCLDLFMLKDLFKSLMTFTYQASLQVGTILYRARLNNYLIFNNINEFYNPPPDLTDLGRANLPNIPIFYCCEVPGFSLLEVKPEKEGQYISLAAFKLKKELRIKMISTGETNNRWKVSPKNYNLKFEKYISNIFQKNYSNKNEII